MKELKDVPTLTEVEMSVDDGLYSPQEVIDLWKENQKLKGELSKETVRKEESFRQEDNLIQENKELRRKTFRYFNEEECWIFNEDGDNYLDSLVCPVVISPDYLRAVFELLYASSMWLDLALEEEEILWDSQQVIDMKMTIHGCKTLLKGFTNEVNKGCN